VKVRRDRNNNFYSSWNSEFANTVRRDTMGVVWPCKENGKDKNAGKSIANKI
jgi:hypothetical protein